MRIAIVATGRFHLLYVAREFAALGHDVRFYSYVPRRRAMGFGLPARCHRALLPWVLPLVVLERKGPPAWNRQVNAVLTKAVDRTAAWRLEPCDVFIGMSGVCVHSAQAAREKYGAKICLQRGSRHILSQKEILEAIPGMRLPAVPDSDVRRELWGYDYSDLVAVPSRHVERSFLERGFPQEKLFRNPYGVDLTMFPPTQKPGNQLPTLVFAGTWCLRKGCDLLAEALNGRAWRLVHAGPVGDAPVPLTARIDRRGFVEQRKLSEVYAEADAFVHPSREEGLSVVQAQALASGLPLVCTDRTGGEDLAEFLEDPAWITVVPPDDAIALRRGIEQALTKAASQNGLRDILGRRRECFTWHAYAERYETKLRQFFGITS